MIVVKVFLLYYNPKWIDANDSGSSVGVSRYDVIWTQRNDVIGNSTIRPGSYIPKFLKSAFREIADFYQCKN